MIAHQKELLYKSSSLPMFGEKITEGFILKPKLEKLDNINLLGCFLGTSVVIIILSLFFIPLILSLLETNIFLGFAALAIFIFPIIYGITYAIYSTIVHLPLEPAQFLLFEYPLKLGKEYQFVFRRGISKNKKTRKPGQLTMVLACIEKVEYWRGTDRETEIHTIYESEPINQFVSEGTNTLEMRGSFQIPSHCPPSFEGKNNQIRWILTIYQDLPELPKNTYSNYTLIVDPIYD